VSNQSTQALLEVKNLKTYFFTEDGVVKAVDGVDFNVNPGEVLGLVGESGCGKSVTSLSIMRLIGIPGKIVEGEIYFEGRSMLDLSEAEMVDMRGNRISMIFQQPQSSLNPVFKVGDQVAEVLQIHQNMGKEESWERAVDLLRLVGIADPERDDPHLSGLPDLHRSGAGHGVLVRREPAAATGAALRDGVSTPRPAALRPALGGTGGGAGRPTSVEA